MDTEFGLQTVTLGGISVIYAELKRKLNGVIGLSQLLAEMLSVSSLNTMSMSFHMKTLTAAHQENVKAQLEVEVNGILTDGARYLFLVLDSASGQFKVKADLYVGGGKTWPYFEDKIIDGIV